MRTDEGAGVTQPGEEKDLGRPYCSLSVPKGGLQEGDSSPRECSDRTRGRALN